MVEFDPQAVGFELIWKFSFCEQKAPNKSGLFILLYLHWNSANHVVAQAHCAILWVVNISFHLNLWNMTACVEAVSIPFYVCGVYTS